MTERSEIDEMAKYIQAMGNLIPEPVQTGRVPDLYELNHGSHNHIDNGMMDLSAMDAQMPRSNHIAPPVALATGDVNEMKDILQRFHAAAGNVVNEAAYDRPLRQSLATERTTHGARVGNWEIVITENGKRKLYDVVHGSTGERIAAELLLYEAARGLAQHLNDGGRINSAEIIDLLKTEQDYAGAIHDMRLYKHHLTKTPNSPRTAIYEDRYGEAKRRAIQARGKVEKLSESL